jgi:hypothetical protein
MIFTVDVKFRTAAKRVELVKYFVISPNPTNIGVLEQDMLGHFEDIVPQDQLVIEELQDFLEEYWPVLF